MSLAFVWGIHRRPVNSPHKWPVMRKMFHLMTSSCYNSINEIYDTEPFIIHKVIQTLTLLMILLHTYWNMEAIWRLRYLHELLAPPIGIDQIRMTDMLTETELSSHLTQLSIAIMDRTQNLKSSLIAHLVYMFMFTCIKMVNRSL